MRLRPEKIEHLAQVVVESLTQYPEVTLQESRDHLVGLVKRVITEDLRLEDEIEEEARRVLEKLGFVQEGYFRENFYDPMTGQFSDTAVYSLLKAAWMGRSP